MSGQSTTRTQECDIFGRGCRSPTNRSPEPWRDSGTAFASGSVTTGRVPDLLRRRWKRRVDATLDTGHIAELSLRRERIGIIHVIDGYLLQLLILNRGFGHDEH